MSQNESRPGGESEEAKVISLDEKRQKGRAVERTPTLGRQGQYSVKSKPQKQQREVRPIVTSAAYFFQLLALVFVFILIMRSCGS